MASPMPDNASLPAVADVVAEFQRSLPGGDKRSHNKLPHDQLMGLLLELHDGNRAQWDLEDLARGADASDTVIAGAKRDIDKLNLERHHLVQQIDAAISEAITQTASATPSTETPALVFDRLSVLVIRIDRTELTAKSSRSDADVYAARLPLLHRQLDVLTTALEALLHDVREGTRRFIPYEHLKLYAP